MAAIIALGQRWGQRSWQKGMEKPRRCFLRHFHLMQDVVWFLLATFLRFNWRSKDHMYLMCTIQVVHNSHCTIMQVFICKSRMQSGKQVHRGNKHVICLSANVFAHHWGAGTFVVEAWTVPGTWPTLQLCSSMVRHNFSWNVLTAWALRKGFSERGIPHQYWL